MSAKLNELRSNSTSQVPGLRLNVRKGHLVVDVAWYVDGRRFSTSYLINGKPLQATERALQRRVDAVGAKYDITTRQAWRRLKAGREGRPGAR
jgi:hypothetical protein